MVQHAKNVNKKKVIFSKDNYLLVGVSMRLKIKMDIVDNLLVHMVNLLQKKMIYKINGYAPMEILIIIKHMAVL